MQSLRHIVVGTDFSPAAESALDCAVTIANLGLAKITVVHVCELSTERGMPDEVATSAFDEQLVQTCTDKLAALVARYARCGVEVKGLLRTGRPWEKLNNAATEVGASLIVIGRDAGSLGLVTGHLLRCSTRPVLTVPISDPALPRAANS